jgi:hypothetical protein
MQSNEHRQLDHYVLVSMSDEQGGFTMLRDREKLFQAYHALLSMVLCFAATLLINQYYELRGSFFLCGFFSFLVTLVFGLIAINKRNTITYLIMLCIFAIIALILWLIKYNPLIWFREYIDWIAVYDGSEELYRVTFSYFTIFLVTCLGTTLFLIITAKQLSKILLAIVIFTFMIISCIKSYEINKAVVGIGIFYIMTIVVEGYGFLYAKRTGTQEKRESILYLVPICFLLAVLAVSFPAKEEPIQWKTVKSIYFTVKEKVESYLLELDYFFNNQNTEFYVRLTGYSDDSGELTNKSGKLIKSDKVAMEFTNTTRLRAAYLLGSVSDIYTGHSWEKSNTGFIPNQEEYMLDYIELAFALARLDPEILKNNKFVMKESFKVHYKHIKTKTFFYPLKTGSYEFTKKESELITEGSAIKFEKAKGRGVAYSTSYYDMNLQGEAFIKMLQDSDEFSYDNPPEINEESQSWMNERALMTDYRSAFFKPSEIYPLLKERASLIDKTYTTLPDTIPQRVKDLAIELTEDCETNYDKLKAIENYLQDYSYTLTPKTAPEGSDFIDYFLFESKEGYCTSFATAMAVLGRCIGVPTRYVEGFVTNTKNRNSNNMYDIKNSQAHAWAEAYFEGIGWIPFEATPKYREVRYTKWAEPAKVVQPISEVINPYEEMMKQNAGAYTGALPLNLNKNDEKKWNEIAFNLFLVLIAILSVVLLFLIYYFILNHQYKKTYKEADTSKKMYMIFLRILAILKQEGFELQEQETILMLAQRVKNHFSHNQIVFSDLANIYMRYRYAQDEVTEQELQQFLWYEEGLRLKQQAEKAAFILWLKEFAFLLKNRNAI